MSFLTAAILIVSLNAQDPVPPTDISTVAHPECTAFGNQRTQALPPGTRSRVTRAVVRMLPEDAGTRNISGASAAPIGGNTNNNSQTEQMGTIDRAVFQSLAKNGVDPAPPTTDAEFIRRVTLDLTGRIPTVARVNTFLADSTSNKRALLIDELLTSPQWVDRWTMYFGDKYQNVRATTQINRWEEGRNAFYLWIKAALAANTPYNQMATALISAKSTDTTYAQSIGTQGQLMWITNGIQSGGGIPQQDTFDQSAANVAETFLGVSHQNCLLCHNGAGHLTSLSLWGGQQTRYQGWQLASFMSRGNWTNSGQNVSPRYWSWQNSRTVDYQLNTTTGNRPSRAASATPNGKDTIVAPQYNYSNPPQKPNAGEDYRVAMARFVTNDFQFARASVNFIWAEMFNMGIVDPPDTFDLARLDPYNPPPAPWTLQPSNPALLDGLARDFIASGYDLKALMREIANSRTYQLSSRYNGTWNDAWEPLFARKMVRRLTAEEIFDAMSQSSNIFVPQTVTQGANGVNITIGPNGVGDTTPFTYMMQLPDTDTTGGTGTNSVGTFLDDFLRGNRRDVFRANDGSAIQALDLMNSTLLMNKLASTGTGATASLMAQNITLPNATLVDNFFMAVLSRHPTSTELSTAMANIPTATGTARNAEVKNLLWTLYNKVDFIFNY